MVFEPQCRRSFANDTEPLEDGHCRCHGMYRRIREWHNTLVHPASPIMLAPNPPSPREAGVCKAGWPAVQVQDDVESASQESRGRSDLSFRGQYFRKIRIPRETGS